MIGKNKHHETVRGALPGIYPRLWRFCLVLSRNRTHADDLAQMTCERALKQADKFTPGTKFDRWIFTIARRIWLNDIRAAKVRQGAGHIPDTDLIDTAAPVEVNILAREVLNKIQTLPEAQRTAVLLTYVEGYSYRETADFMESPIGTVMSRLAAARKVLCAQIADERTDK